MTKRKEQFTIISDKPDFRKTLNFMLSVYYHKAQATLIHEDVRKERLPISDEDLSAGFSTLQKDGYVDQILPEYSFYPLGVITGKGRIFHEAGGYKDETTRVDKIIKWAKNHRVLSYIIVAVIVLTSLLGLVELISKIANLFPHTTK